MQKKIYLQQKVIQNNILQIINDKPYGLPNAHHFHGLSQGSPSNSVGYLPKPILKDSQPIGKTDTGLSKG